MKIIVTRESIVEAMRYASKFVQKKTTLDIIQGMLFSAKNGRLTISGTDLENSMKVEIPVDTIEAGELVFPATVEEYIRKLPIGEVEISTEGSKISIKSGKTVFNLTTGMEAESFPDLPKLPEDVSNLNVVELSERSLAILIERTAFAVSREAIRPILQGVLLEAVGTKASMLALDGFRMAISSCGIPKEVNAKCVLMGTALAELGKLLLDDDKSMVQIFIGARQAIFKFRNVEFSTRLLEGEFIKYKDIIPAKSTTTIKVNADVLTEAVDRCCVLIKGDSNYHVRMLISEKELKLSTKSGNGASDVNMAIAKDGEDLEIAFNPTLLSDGLKRLSGDVTFHLGTNISPAYFTTSNMDDLLYLVLPTRFKK